MYIGLQHLHSFLSYLVIAGLILILTRIPWAAWP